MKKFKRTKRKVVTIETITVTENYSSISSGKTKRWSKWIKFFKNLWAIALPMVNVFSDALMRIPSVLAEAFGKSG